jgi:hypothetical protein
MKIIRNSFEIIKPQWFRSSFVVLLYFALSVFLGFIAAAISLAVPGTNSNLNESMQRLVHAALMTVPTTWFLAVFLRLAERTGARYEILTWPGWRCTLSVFAFQMLTQISALALTIPAAALATDHPVQSLALIFGIAGSLFWVLVRISFAPLYIIDQKNSLWTAISNSWKNTRGAFWRYSGHFLLLGLTVFAGLLLFGIGVLLTFAIGVVGYILLYKMSESSKNPS